MLSFILGLAGPAMAQNFNCGTTQKYWELVAKYPHVLSAQQHLDSITRLGSGSSRVDSPEVYIIPLVFHVIHNYGAENISDEQIYDAVRILNQDYRKLNADTSAIVPSFQALAGDAHIEFRLASKDPHGNCTNGIDRIQSLQTYNGNDESKLNAWPQDYYLNIWVVAKMKDGVAGYAYYPGAVTGQITKYDGVIILHDYVGSIGTASPLRSRALTHEIGHSLNLPHTWGNNNNPGVACGDDGIQDTPETNGHTSCNLNAAFCNPPIVENVQNYMEYAYCSNMFTLGQIDVMRLALQSATGNRNNLWTDANRMFTGTYYGPQVCAPKADFYSVQNMVCEGDLVNFKNASWGDSITSFSWTFDGGTPATSTDANPSVSFSTPGWHNVTLTVTAGGGSATISKNNLVYVTPSYANYFGFYSENFEDEARFENDFISLNLDPISESEWEYNKEAGYNSWRCAKLTNYNNIVNDVDELVGPTIDLSGLSGNQYLYFHYSNATSAPTYAQIKDSLRVYYSVNCGKTWTRLSVLTGLDLATDGFHAESYTPVQYRGWKSHVITLPQAALTSNFRFKFQFKSTELGNNIFLDNINVSSVVGITEQEVFDANVNMYPNPAKNQLNINYSLTSAGDVHVGVYDLLGREVLSANALNQQVGNQTLQLNTTALQNGVYLVKLQAGDQTITRKVVIAK